MTHSPAAPTPPPPAVSAPTPPAAPAPPPPAAPVPTPLMKLTDLSVTFQTRDRTVHAVNGVNMELVEGEVLCILGESGSGKSVTLRALMRLLPKFARVTGGIEVAGQNVVAMSNRRMADFRGGEVAMIFQEPMTALDPVFTIGRQIAEVVQRHEGASRATATARALELLELVQIPSARRRLDAYPHELSGGLRQRAMIAVALACRPKLLLADEPTTALDATVQIQVLLLLRELQQRLGMGVVFVTHDLEIRGAGEVLGDSQSGGIQDIGFTLYSDMLNAAVKSLKAGREPDLLKPLNVSTEINLHTPALLPETYCGDVHERLVIYKRLANCSEETALDQLQEELIDRFGLLPPPTQTLVDCHRLRILGKPLDLLKIDASAQAIMVQFGVDTPIHPHRVIQLVQQKRHYKLAGQDKLRIEKKLENVRERVTEIKGILRELTPDVLNPAKAAA